MLKIRQSATNYINMQALYEAYIIGSTTSLVKTYIIWKRKITIKQY